LLHCSGLRQTRLTQEQAHFREAEIGNKVLFYQALDKNTSWLMSQESHTRTREAVIALSKTTRKWF
jgi:hypothetical protein